MKAAMLLMVQYDALAVIPAARGIPPPKLQYLRSRLMNIAKISSLEESSERLVREGQFAEHSDSGGI